MRLEIDEVISGGMSIPRNEVLMKMFNLIDIGERAGSGVPSIYKVWSDQQWMSPEISERLDRVERTMITLPFVEVTKKSSDKKVAIKSEEDGGNLGGNGGNLGGNGGNLGGNHLAVIELIENEPEITLIEMSERAGTSLRTIERIVSELKKAGKIERVGSNRTGHWKVLN